MRKILALAVLLALAVTPAFAKDKIVRNDLGGNAAMYIIKANEIRNTGGMVKFDGRCNSACTIYLTVKNACVTPKAKFGFHLAFNARKGNTAATAKMTKMMMGMYPGWVRGWINQNGGLTKNIKTMKYDYASKYLPTCK